MLRETGQSVFCFCCRPLALTFFFSPCCKKGWLFKLHSLPSSTNKPLAILLYYQLTLFAHRTAISIMFKYLRDFRFLIYLNQGPTAMPATMFTFFFSI